MKKIILILFVAFAFFACKKENSNQENATKKDITAQKTENATSKLSEAEQKAIDEQTNSVPAPPDYAKLILGRWELKEDRNFWAFFDKSKVYGDGNEQGTTYKIEAGKIIFGSDDEYLILYINEKEMLLQAYGQNQIWVKADFDGLPTEQENTKIDPKKLVGLWDMEGGDDFSSIRFKANGKYDIVPFADAYTYKVEGNKIFFKKTSNAPPSANAEFTEEIVKLDDKTLILKIDGNEVKYKKSKNK